MTDHKTGKNRTNAGDHGRRRARAAADPLRHGARSASPAKSSRRAACRTARMREPSASTRFRSTKSAAAAPSKCSRSSIARSNAARSRHGRPRAPAAAAISSRCVAPTKNGARGGSRERSLPTSTSCGGSRDPRSTIAISSPIVSTTRSSSKLPPARARRRSSSRVSSRSSNRGRATVTEIVAVTFSEKAAGELKLRLREELERARDRGRRRQRDQPPARCGRARVRRSARQHHSRLLRRAVCASVPSRPESIPSFEVMTQAQSDQSLRRSVRGWMEQALPAPGEGVRRSLRRPTPVSWWRDDEEENGPIARLRRAGRELLQWRDHPAAWKRPVWDRESDDRRSRPVGARRRDDDRVANLRARHPLSGHGVAAAHRRRDHARTAAHAPARLRRARSAARRRWRPTEASRPNAKAAARCTRAWCPRQAVLRQARGVAGGAEELQSGRRRRPRGAAARRAAGTAFAATRIGSCDRDARLSRPADSRARSRTRLRPGARAFQQRFKYILVDEFQDTDPLQAELLADACVGRPRGRVRPGALFIVGDPKQSIYRFRRADVGIYQQVCDDLQRERCPAASTQAVVPQRSQPSALRQRGVRAKR